MQTRHSERSEESQRCFGKPQHDVNILSPSNIFKAYIDCRRRKRSTVNAQKFERDLCTNIVSLTKSLASGNYEPGKSICFVVRNPKPREVFAADFKDRIVHHLVVRFLEKHWEKVFIHDSYACRKNKGTLAAVERLHHNMLSISGDGKGLPIGNLTSQFFANVYLNALDQFIKHVLKIKYYVRYVDDFVIMHEDKEQLRNWLEKIKGFLLEKLGASLKNEVKVAPLSNGINFLGYVQHIFYRLVRRRVVNNFRNKLREWENPSQSLLRQAQQPTALPKGEPRKNLPLTQGEVSRSDGEGNQFFALLTKLRSVLTSYLAYSSKANSFRILLKTLHPHQWLKQFFKLYRTKASFVEDIAFVHKSIITNFFRREK